MSWFKQLMLGRIILLNNNGQVGEVIVYVMGWSPLPKTASECQSGE